MSILLVSGSPSLQSRSSALLDHIGALLFSHGEDVEELPIRSLPGSALLAADATHPVVATAIAQVARAQSIVIATPIYKAAYSGVLKVFLDLLPQNALAGKRVLPIATGGSAHHMLALDYALRPVLQSLSAQHVLAGVYATDTQFTKDDDGYRVSLETIARLDDAALALLPRSLNQRGDHATYARTDAVASDRCPA